MRFPTTCSICRMRRAAWSVRLYADMWSPVCHECHRETVVPLLCDCSDCTGYVRSMSADEVHHRALELAADRVPVLPEPEPERPRSLE